MKRTTIMLAMFAALVTGAEDVSTGGAAPAPAQRRRLVLADESRPRLHYWDSADPSACFSISFAGEPPEFIRGAHVKNIKAKNLKVEGVNGPFLRTWGGEPKIETNDLKGIAPTVVPATEPFRVRPI